MYLQNHYIHDAPRRRLSRFVRGGCLFFVTLTLLLIALAGTVTAQEALINSLSGEYAAEVAKQAMANQHFNLKMGDLKLRFDSSIAVVGNDNVNLTSDHRQADVSVRPEVDVASFWPITDKNALTFNMGVGYAKYLRTSQLDAFFLTPNSLLSFNIYAGDFLINLHNRFTYQQDAAQTTEVSGTGQYAYFQNTSGLTVTWDLNKFIITLGYDHDIYTASESVYAYQNHSSKLFSSRIAFAINPTSQAGIELGAGATAFDVAPAYTNQVVGISTNQVPLGRFLSNQKYVNAGPFIRLGLSPYLQFRLSAGYAMYFQEVASIFGPAGNTAAYYTEFTLNHIVNSRLRYTLAAGHQLSQGVWSQTSDLYYARLEPTWNIVYKTTISTPVSYERVKGSSSTALTSDTYDYYTIGIQASYSMTKKLHIAGGYTYRLKESNIAAYSYFQNQLVFDLRYRF